MRPRKRPVKISVGGSTFLNQEYKHTIDGKLIPINESSPVYSSGAKKQIKQMKQQEQEYFESMCGEVITYNIHDPKKD